MPGTHSHPSPLSAMFAFGVFPTQPQKQAFESGSTVGEASHHRPRVSLAGIPITAVHLPAGADGRPSGEAYVELLSADNVQEALKKDRATMGTRYVEGMFIAQRMAVTMKSRTSALVFTVSGPELQQFLKRLEVKRSLADKGFVRVRGLPYNCTREDMDSFFKGMLRH